MNRFLWAAVGLFVVALIAGVIAFVIIVPTLVHPMRMVFFSTGTLSLAALLIGAVQD